MRIEPDSANPQGQIDIADFRSPADVSNAGALQLCVQDTVNTEAWINQNYWNLRWREADWLYQSPPSIQMWDGTTQPKSNVNRFVVAETVNAIHPQIMNGLFYEALGLDTLVRTKHGFTPIKDIHVGDQVYGRDGLLHEVKGESPIYENRPCYRITFSGGVSVIADATHLWETVAQQINPKIGRGRAGKKEEKIAVRTTERILESLLLNRKEHRKPEYNHGISLSAPIVGEETVFSIHPYVLGAWLGDGDSDAPRITQDRKDVALIRKIEQIENISAKENSNAHNAASRYSFTKYEHGLSLQKRLRRLGVFENKHIPQEYLNASVSQRMELLRGLLDTDGCCTETGHVNFRNSNPELARGAWVLACSLGYRATITEYKDERHTSGKFYSVQFTPNREDKVFSLPRKADRQKVSTDRRVNSWVITSIEKAPSVPVKCLSVDGSFYLITEAGIPTHNSPPFVLRPRPNMTQNASRAISTVIATELDDINFRQEVDWGLFSALNFGTAIWKYGFKSFTRKVTKYEPVGNVVSVTSKLPDAPDTILETPDSMTYKKVVEEEDVHTPTFENKDGRMVLVDPGLKVPDIRKAKFVVDKMHLTYRDLIKLAAEEYVAEEGGRQVLKKRYMLPDEATIKSWFEPPQENVAHGSQAESTSVQGTASVHHAKPSFAKTTVDPLDEPLEVLERWDNEKVITVLNRVKVIRNEPNEFGCIPFLSLNWWNIPDAFWGLGLGRVIGVEQRVQAGIINACLDLASLIVNPMFVRSRGANIQEQQIRQRIGGIIAVDGKATEALTLLEQPTIPAEVINQISLSQQRVATTSGADQQLTMGVNTGKGGAMRTGTGAAGLIQATMNRIGGFAETFVRNVYEPFIYKVHEMNKTKMPIGYIKKLLGDKLGTDDEVVQKFDHKSFMTGSAEFEVLAGSHLAAKSQMAQSLFMMMQMFESQPMMDQLNKISNKKVNIEELFHMIHDISGWKNYYDIIQDMTPEEIQRQQASSPAAQMQAKLQGQMTLNDQKAKQKEQAIDQENEGRAARDIFRIIAEKSAEPEALLGAEAPSQGLGSNEAG